jgi:hypothetical protein
MDDQSKIRAALGKLTSTLASIARTADEKNRERCPYKTAAMLCTFHGGCQNQRRGTGVVHCAGDERLTWVNPSSSHNGFS